jgi:ABC-type uncharacterized transport system substrate-binding protein
MIRRREFITLLGGAAVAWPLAARAQQADRVRRIGVLMSVDENDPRATTIASAFTQALAGLGWTEGRNVRTDLRWAGGDIIRTRALAVELVGLQPDIILANGAAVTLALQRETQTIPIVFANLADPVATGIVPRLDRPGGNSTSFANLEASLAGKWLELLSEIAPGLKRAAIMFNPDTFAASAYMPSLETAAAALMSGCKHEKAPAKAGAISRSRRRAAGSMGVWQGRAPWRSCGSLARTACRSRWPTNRIGMGWRAAVELPTCMTPGSRDSSRTNDSLALEPF